MELNDKRGTSSHEYEKKTNSNEALDLSCSNAINKSQEVKPYSSCEKEHEFYSSAKRFKISRDQSIDFENEGNLSGHSPVKQLSVEDKLSVHRETPSQLETARVAESCKCSSAWSEVNIHLDERSEPSSSNIQVTKDVEKQTEGVHLQRYCDTTKQNSSSAQNTNEKYGHISNDIEETAPLPIFNKVVELENCTCRGCNLSTDSLAKPARKQLQTISISQVPLQCNASPLHQATPPLNFSSILKSPQLNASIFNPQTVCACFPQLNTSLAQLETSTIIQTPPQYNTSTIPQETLTSPHIKTLILDHQASCAYHRQFTLLTDTQKVCPHFQQFSTSTPQIDTSTSNTHPLNLCPHRPQVNTSTRRSETSTTSQAPPHSSKSTIELETSTIAQTPSQFNTSINDSQNVCPHRLQFNQISTSTVPSKIAYSQPSATHQALPTDLQTAAQTENITIAEVVQPRKTSIKQEKYNLTNSQIQPSKVCHPEPHQEGCTSSTKVEPTPQRHRCISQEGYALSSVPQTQESCIDTSTVPQMFIPRVACILTPQLQDSTASHAILQADKLTLGLQFQPTILQTMYPQRKGCVFYSQLQTSAVPQSIQQPNEGLLVSQIHAPANIRPILQVLPQTNNECALGAQSHTPPTSLKSDECVLGLQFQSPVVSSAMKNFIQPPSYYFSLQLQSSNEKIDHSKSSSFRLQVQKEEAVPRSEKTNPSASNNTSNVSQKSDEDVSCPEERPRVVEDVQIAAEALNLLKTSGRLNIPLADQPIEIGISAPALNTEGQSLQNETIRLKLPRQALERTGSDQSHFAPPEYRSQVPRDSLSSNGHESAGNDALQSRKTNQSLEMSKMQRNKFKYVSTQIAKQLTDAKSKKSTSHNSKVQILDNVTLKTSASVETITSPSSLHLPDISDIPHPLKPSSAHGYTKELLNSSPPQIKIAPEELVRMLGIPTRCQIPLDSIHLPKFAATGVKIDTSYFKARVNKKPKKSTTEKKYKSSSKQNSDNRKKKGVSKSITPASLPSHVTTDKAKNYDKSKTNPSKNCLLAVTPFSALQRNKTTLSKTAVKNFSKAKPFIISMASLNTTQGVITPLVQPTRLDRENASVSCEGIELKSSSKTTRDELKLPNKKTVQNEKITYNKTEKRDKKGNLCPVKSLKSPVDTFALLINGEMIEKIVKFTNARIDDPTDKAELKAFIGLLLISGALKQNTLTDQEIWSECFGTGIHRATLTESRFQLLSENISFGDNTSIDENSCIGSFWEEYLDNCKRYSLPLLHISSNDKVSSGFIDGVDHESDYNCSTARKTVNISLRMLCNMLDGAGTRGLAMFHRKNPFIKMSLREYMKQVGITLVRPHLRKRLQRKSLKTPIRDLIESILNKTNDRERRTFIPPPAKKIRYNLECQLCSWKEGSMKRTQIQCYSCHRTMCKKHRTKLCTDCAKEL